MESSLASAPDVHAELARAFQKVLTQLGVFGKLAHMCVKDVPGLLL